MAVVCTVVCVLAASAVWYGRATAPALAGASPGYVDALRRLGGTPEPAGARWSVTGVPPRCVAATGRVDRHRCEALRALAARAASAAAQTGTPDALYATALVDLWGAPPTPARVGRALSQLKLLEPLVPRDARLLSDIAAGALVRAELTGEARPLLEAIEYADRAAELEPASLPAAYNRALALHRLGLTVQASHAAAAYLRRDAVSVWAPVMRDLAARANAPGARAVPTADDDSATVAAYAVRDHEAARRFGWEVGLGTWGALAERGDGPGADRWLRVSEILGRTLEAQGGDATLADAVGAIRTAGTDSPIRRRLARAHRRFAEAERAYGARAFEAAAVAYTALLRAPDVPTPVAHWARVQLGSSLVNSGRAARGERVLRAVLTAADHRRHPGLVGRAYGSLSTSLLRRGSDDAARVAWDSAAWYFARAGDRESAAAIQVFATNGAFFRGDPSEGYRAARATLVALHDHPGSFWRHIVLAVLAEEAAADGLPRAALLCQDEGVIAAAASGRPLALAEALAARVQLRVATGRTQGAAEDLGRARAITAAAAPGSGRRWSEADVLYAEGLWLAATRQPGGAAAAVRALDSAVAFFSAQRNVERLTPVLAARVEANVSAGAIPAALRDLRAAATLVADRASTMRNSVERAMLFRSSRRVLERLVALRMATGALREALTDVEQVRSALSSDVGPASGSDHPRGPVRETGVVYQRVADTLLIWTVLGAEVWVARQTVDGRALSDLIERTRASLELRRPASVTRPLLAALHEVLVRPVSDYLGPRDRPLVMVADGELARVPFAALYDARRGRYLIEERQLRFVTSLREAGADGDARRPDMRGAAGPAAATLVVGDPAVDARTHPEWPPLTSAREEARVVAGLYPGGVLLVGASARADTVRRALARVSLVHYAGHAAFDDERPGRSYLVLAGAGESSRLAASEITRLPLAGVRLVVLSACRTVGAQRDAVGALAGLAGAFRAAGARGVVGSTWLVDDELTLPLMVALHRHYAAGGDGPAALRAAQLALLHAPSPALQSPAAWAAFRYLGR